MDSKSMATVFVRYNIIICERAYDNQPCECKLCRVISLLISFVPNALSHFCKLQTNLAVVMNILLQWYK